MNLEEIEVKHIAPIEFEDGIVQFLIDKSPDIQDALPIILWVEEKTVSRDPIGDYYGFCNCQKFYRVTNRSVFFLSSLHIGLDHLGFIVLCKCLGKIIE